MDESEGGARLSQATPGVAGFTLRTALADVTRTASYFLACFQSMVVVELLLTVRDGVLEVASWGLGGARLDFSTLIKPYTPTVL